MEPADVLKTAFAMPLTSPSFALLGWPERQVTTGSHELT